MHMIKRDSKSLLGNSIFAAHFLMAGKLLFRSFQYLLKAHMVKVPSKSFKIFQKYDEVGMHR